MSFSLRILDRRTESVVVTRSFPFRGVSLGRGLACDVVLKDPSVSRDHALLWQEGSGFQLRVLGRYGTSVAGREVAMGDVVAVEPEAEIRIGPFSVFVEAPAPPDPAALARSESAPDAAPDPEPSADAPSGDVPSGDVAGKTVKKGQEVRAP